MEERSDGETMQRKRYKRAICKRENTQAHMTNHTASYDSPQLPTIYCVPGTAAAGANSSDPADNPMIKVLVSSPFYQRGKGGQT